MKCVNNIYITSPINATTLLNETEAGVKYGSYYANELNELVKAGIKPKNLTPPISMIKTK